MLINYLSIVLTLLSAMPPLVASASPTKESTPPPPNILWISWEDVGPHLGAYGDDYAITPNIDQLAQEGITYLNAYSNYPVCAPARSTIITGQYASSYGGQNMRSRNIPFDTVRLFPQLLKEAGYYCTNDVKTDYQLECDLDFVWDKTELGARWDGRKEGQPFFSVINLVTTHEGHSRTTNTLWVRKLEQILGSKRHDPKLAPIPPYFPDNEIVRENIALYYDNLTYTDSISGTILDQLENEGLMDNTIVMFWGDHGWGLPRGKRWPYQSGLKVPLIIRIPEKYQEAWSRNRNHAAGTKTDELVSFVDFAPTVLSMAEIEIPEYMQGQAFLGPTAKAPRQYVYGGRGRMDETYDCIRTVIDKDYLYIRNYASHLPHVQTIRTMEQHPIMKSLRELHAGNKLNGDQSKFFQATKPVEELYDLKKDPHQLNNLTNKASSQKLLMKFREKNTKWMMEIEDVGLATEPILEARNRSNGTWPKTSGPTAVLKRTFWNGDLEILLECTTPGASIAWRYRDIEEWKIYNKPLLLKSNSKVVAKANRVGYSPSKKVEIGTDFKPSASDNPVPGLKKFDLKLGTIHQMKELDLRGKDVLTDFYSYLKNHNESIRYWAVVGVRTLSETDPEKSRARDTLAQMILDNSPIVKIEAAYGLCELGDFDLGIPVLKEALTHPLETVRLFALNHLDKMGEKAQLALPFPEIPLGTANYYSSRIMIRIYKRLGIEPQDLTYAGPAQVEEIQRIYDGMVIENLWDYGF